MNTYTTRDEAITSLSDILSGDGHIEETYNLETLADDLIELKDDGTYGLIEVGADEFVTIAQRHER